MEIAALAEKSNLGERSDPDTPVGYSHFRAVDVRREYGHDARACSCSDSTGPDEGPDRLHHSNRQEVSPRELSLFVSQQDSRVAKRGEAERVYGLLACVDRRSSRCIHGIPA